MQTLIYLAITIAMVPVAIAIYKRVFSGQQRSAEAGTFAADGSGATIAGTLRPVVDPGICMGSGGCVIACPYHALSLVRGRAVLVNPDHCLGHGGCASACPVGAITLVPAAA